MHVTVLQPGKAPGGALTALANPSLPHPVLTVWTVTTLAHIPLRPGQ